MRKPRSGFTIIEILVAIIIFGIGMMALLRAIIYFVGASDEVKQKAVAILLAKEAIDVIYNQRDTNILRSVRWDCAHIDATKPEACAYRFEAGSLYRIEFNGMTGYTISDPRQTTTGLLANQLYVNINNGVHMYTHQETDTPSPFSRYVQFEPAVLGGTSLSGDNAFKMTVYVQYIRGNKAPRQVILESLLSAGEKAK